MTVDRQDKVVSRSFGPTIDSKLRSACMENEEECYVESGNCLADRKGRGKTIAN